MGLNYQVAGNAYKNFQGLFEIKQVSFVFLVLILIIYEQAIPVNKVNRKAIFMFSVINSVGIGVMVVF